MVTSTCSTTTGESIDWHRLTSRLSGALLFGLLALFSACAPMGGDELPASNSAHWQPTVDGLRMPVDLQSSPDGRLFVVERAGRIYQLDDGRGRPAPFLDLSSLVTTGGGEQGLLALAFDPNFEVNGRLFVHYTDRGGDTVIASYRTDSAGSGVDPLSEQRVLTLEQPYRNHNGGPLVFGPDGYLYVGLGDGGGAGDPHDHGQRLDTLLGKILRLDVDSASAYRIPADNPFVDRPGARPEIWAFGLRNPWRLTFDAQGGLFIADVGQNKWEEINYVQADDGGRNFGWNRWEGSQPFAGGDVVSLKPIDEYDHDQGCAVTGGPIIRDPELPGWQGLYLYGDACSGRIWGLRRAGDTWRGGLLFDTNLRITTFGTGPAAEVLVADYRDEGARLLRLLPQR